jgi:beta-glucosidase
MFSTVLHSRTRARFRKDSTGAPPHRRTRSRAHGTRTAASDDVAAADGKVYDTDRIVFLRSYLTQLQRATADGVPVKGYFQWSTMDNFEWINGYGDRFGLVYVDFKTQERTLKLSAEWFREAARGNAVV